MPPFTGGSSIAPAGPGRPAPGRRTAAAGPQVRACRVAGAGVRVGPSAVHPRRIRTTRHRAAHRSGGRVRRHRPRAVGAADGNVHPVARPGGETHHRWLHAEEGVVQPAEEGLRVHVIGGREVRRQCAVAGHRRRGAHRDAERLGRVDDEVVAELEAERDRHLHGRVVHLLGADPPRQHDGTALPRRIDRIRSGQGIGPQRPQHEHLGPLLRDGRREAGDGRRGSGLLGGGRTGDAGQDGQHAER